MHGNIVDTDDGHSAQLALIESISDCSDLSAMLIAHCNAEGFPQHSIDHTLALFRRL